MGFRNLQEKLEKNMSSTNNKYLFNALNLQFCKYLDSEKLL